MPTSTYLRLSAQRRAEIKDTVMRLYCEQPYEQVGVRAITKACAISTGSFYKYFSSKDEMYLHFYCEIEKKYFDADWKLCPSVFKEHAGKDYESLLNPLEMRFNETWLYAPEALLQQYYFGGAAFRIYYPVLEELRSLQAAGIIHAHIDVDFTYYMLISSLFNLLLYVRRQGLSNKEQINKLKRRYLEDSFFKNLIKTEFYPEITGQLQGRVQG